MYYVSKRLEISSAHSLSLSYQSKCEALHGHNWIVKVYCKSETLNEDGMVTDFTLIKKQIGDFFIPETTILDIIAQQVVQLVATVEQRTFVSALYAVGKHVAMHVGDVGHARKHA